VWHEEEAGGRVALTTLIGHQLSRHVWLATRKPPHPDSVAAVRVLLTRAFARAAAGSSPA
jgi:hypothetical protein